MTELRIIEGDWLEFENVRIARLLPNLGATLLYRLIAVFDAIDEDEAYIAELEARVAQLEARLKAPAQ